jgi:glycosyltransferase involved in cell wall biosynthesis
MKRPEIRGRRILLLTTVMEAGGAQKAMMQLARGLHRRGHEVTVVAMYDKAGSIPDFEARFGLPVIDLAMRPNGSALRRLVAMLSGVVRLHRLLRQRQVDVLQSFTHYSNILGPVVGYLSGVPVRVTSQRNPLELRSPWLLRADHFISRSRLAQRMVAVSKSVAEYCIAHEGLATENVVTIVNGLDLTEWSFSDTDAIRHRTRRALGLGPEHLAVSTVARLHPQKGHDMFLEAIEKLIEKVPSARFLWIGDGELRHELNRQIHERRLADHVQLLGTRQDVPELLLASDLFVLPSLWEGMPNAVLEAMAAGLPVVATAVDGTPEVVEAEVTGWLVPPSDPDALFRAIYAALHDRGRRQRMAEGGRRRIEAHFSIDRYVEGFETLYAQLLAERGS